MILATVTTKRQTSDVDAVVSDMHCTKLRRPGSFSVLGPEHTFTGGNVGVLAVSSVCNETFDEKEGISWEEDGLTNSSSSLVSAWGVISK
jgi:hypothetical protein